MDQDIEERVAQHYAREHLEETILAALQASGIDTNRLTQSDLAAADEFHTGGRQATIEFASEIGFRPGMQLLDIGSGIGGSSRYFADAHGCTVTGVDLTEDYVRTAASLARRVGLETRVSYRQASALALPFEANSFDGAYMMHVGMNIEDKPALFKEIRRVLKPGGTFAIFDIMRKGPGDLAFPVPWSEVPATSFVTSPAEYRAALVGAGFEVVKERDRRDFAFDFFRKAQAKAAEMGGPPAVGIHLLMGANAKVKIENVIANLQGGLIAPTEMICVAK
jgi:ubiquinone/menaquinone biosynthesis C-methylase UbiE